MIRYTKKQSDENKLISMKTMISILAAKCDYLTCSGLHNYKAHVRLDD
jgi:hypothetical protein